jgi:uncharacterized protein with HEPN domain
MQREDRIRIEHMCEAADTVLALARGRTREDLNNEVMLRLAMVRAIEIIGEAASRVSRPTKDATPTIPWPAIVGMRNRLSHAYFDIDYDIVWRTATSEIPALLLRLRELL